MQALLVLKRSRQTCLRGRAVVVHNILTRSLATDPITTSTTASTTSRETKRQRQNRLQQEIHKDTVTTGFDSRQRKFNNLLNKLLDPPPPPKDSSRKDSESAGSRIQRSPSGGNFKPASAPRPDPPGGKMKRVLEPLLRDSGTSRPTKKDTRTDKLLTLSSIVDRSGNKTNSVREESRLKDKNINENNIVKSNDTVENENITTTASTTNNGGSSSDLFERLAQLVKKDDQHTPFVKSTPSMFDLDRRLSQRLRMDDRFATSTKYSRSHRLKTERPGSHINKSVASAAYDSPLSPQPAATAYPDYSHIEKSKVPSSEMGQDPLLQELFKSPEPVASRHPQAYPLKLWNEYSVLLKDVMGEDGSRLMKPVSKSAKKPLLEEELKLVFDYLNTDHPVVEVDIPIFDQALKSGDGFLQRIREGPSQEFQNQLRLQRDRFYEAMGLTSIAQRTKLEKSLLHLNGICVKRKQGYAVPILWSKVKEVGLHTEAPIQSIMYAAFTFPITDDSSWQERLSVGTGSPIFQVLDDIKKRQKSDIVGGVKTSGYVDIADIGVIEEGVQTDLLNEIACYHDLLLHASEQSTIINVRLLVSKGQAHDAEELLNEYSRLVKTVVQDGKETLQWRTYAPIIKLYMDQGHVVEALSLYTRVQKYKTVVLDAEAKGSVLADFLAAGCFNPDYPPLKGATELGYKASSGPDLWNEMVQDLGENHYELPTSTVNRLYKASMKAFGDQLAPNTANLHLMLMPPTSSELADDDKPIVTCVSMKDKSGICPCSGVKLKLIGLTEEDMTVFRDNLMNVALQHQKKFRPNKKHQLRTDLALRNFLDWLNTREGDPYTVVVDGANVGFYSQNVTTGTFSLSQITSIVRILEEQNEKPLVILPHKYSYNQFTLPLQSSQPTQTLTAEEIRTRESLLEKKQLYIAPAGSLDDYFWMISSTANQHTATSGKSLDVPHDNVEGRWPGKRPMLVTNDQMKDHRLVFTDGMFFRRWYSNYIVHYAWVNQSGQMYRDDVVFSAADSFSREIQCNETKNGTVWHFPIANTPDEWFCMRLPNKSKGK